MTVLQMSGTDDEGDNPPPSKKRRLLSENKTEQRRSSIETWLKSVETTREEDPHQMPAAHHTMVNGYGLSDAYSQPLVQRSPEENGYSDSIIPIVPFPNLGNTCFLNSVLYTLRFAPAFLHKLHHLNMNIKQISATKMDRNCSLTRNLGKSNSWSNKDFSYNADCSDGKIQTVVDKLHSLYATLCCNEFKDRMEPYQPTSFLQSLREVNPIFEGNQQHDAHELLVCLLDIIREACELTNHEKNVLVEAPTEPECTVPAKSLTVKSLTRKLKNFPKRWRGNSSDGDIKKYLKNGNATMEVEDDNLSVDERYNSTSQDSIFEDFRGVSLLRTTCLECEQVTERKETFCDICVPIPILDYEDEVQVDELYQSIIVTEEFLIDNNKYWCERCSRYNEAKRCVKYEKLPRLLTLHLKRFSSNFGTSVAKVNDHMPTPFMLSCFCEECLSIKHPEERPHYYMLYAIIMHVGPTIASGHYVAFVKTLDNSQDYLFCSRDKPKTSSLPRGISGKTPSSLNSSSSSMMDKAYNLLKLSSKSFNGNCSGSSSTSSRELELRGTRMTPSCKGSECCSLRLRGLSTTDQDSDSVWLECDDDTIRVHSTHELDEILSPRSNKNSGVTPYLLFYARVDN